MVPTGSSVLLRASVSEGKSLLRNAKSPVTPGFPFICFGTTPIPNATSQTCSILSTIPTIEMQGAVCHKTLIRVQPLLSDIVENALTTGQCHRILNYSQSLPNTMSPNLYHLLGKLLAPEIIIYSEENEARD